MAFCILFFTVFIGARSVLANKRRECFIITMLSFIIIDEFCIICNVCLTYRIDHLEESLTLHKGLTYSVKYMEAFSNLCLSMFHWVFALQYLQTSFIFPLLLGNVELKLDIDEMNESFLPES